MEDNLYLIGEFASINKVSTRMLRHYDKIGILQPNRVLTNGYRYYSEDQISVISQIKMLRSCEFLLDEIMEILKNKNPQFLKKQAELKIKELQKQTSIQQSAIGILCKLAQNKENDSFENLYGISLIKRYETKLLVSKYAFSIDNIEDEFDKLYYFLEEKKLSTKGYLVLLNCFDDSKENQNQIGLSIKTEYNDGKYHTIDLPQTFVLSTTHYGDYYNIAYAYSSIIKYAEYYGYEINHDFMERYFIDNSHTKISDEFVTEISVSIKNKS